MATSVPAALPQSEALLAGGDHFRLAYAPAEVAAIVGLSRSKVMALIASGEIPSLKVGRARRVLHSDVVAWLDSLKHS